MPNGLSGIEGGSLGSKRRRSAANRQRVFVDNIKTDSKGGYHGEDR